MRIEITQEMIEAGQRALARACGKDLASQELVCKVWRAMAAKCPPIKVALPEGAVLESIVIQLS